MLWSLPGYCEGSEIEPELIAGRWLVDGEWTERRHIFVVKSCILW